MRSRRYPWFRDLEPLAAVCRRWGVDRMASDAAFAHAIRGVWLQGADPEVVDATLPSLREASHQRVRWPAEHDAGKTPADWFWLVGYLAGKALHAVVEGRREKALHHVVTTAAALANWHAALTGAHNRMRPGIEPPEGT